jgi:hypothetical protein
MCTTCKLQKLSYKKKGLKRSFENGITSGKHWSADIIYLPKLSNGFRFIFVMAERLTGFVTAMPLQTLTAGNLAAAIRTFLGIFPAPVTIGLDHGSKLSIKFTKELARFGIENVGIISQRSQQQGNVERAIGQFKIQLSKLCSLSHFGGRKNWHLALPSLISTINQTHPYGLPMSRTQLLFFPCMYQSLSNIIENPVLMQKRTFEALNAKRIQNMVQDKTSISVKPFSVGHYVLLEDDNVKTVDGSRQLRLPKFQDIYKINDIGHNGFSLTLLNLRAALIIKSICLL